MERHICPYLGRPDDAQIPLAYPSDGNLCQKAAPPAAVARPHQASFCLSAQHSACPVYLARTSAPLPAALAAPHARAAQTGRTLARSALAGAALVIYLAALWLNGPALAARLLALNHPPDPAGSAGQAGVFSGLFGLGQGELPAGGPPAAQAAPPGAPQAAAPTPLPLPGGACPLPQGWQTYTVQPADSLFRISVLYGVSQETLLQANCLGSQAQIAPGATVYVPIQAQPTASPTRAAPVHVLAPPQTRAGEDDAAGQPADPTPGAVDTAIPPTPTAGQPPSAGQPPPTGQPPRGPSDHPTQPAPKDKPKDPPKDKPPKDKPPKEKPPKEKPPKDNGKGNGGEKDKGGQGGGKGGGHGKP